MMSFNTDLPLTDYLGDKNVIVLPLYDIEVDLSHSFVSAQVKQKMQKIIKLGIPLPIVRQKHENYVGLQKDHEWYLSELALMNPEIFYYLTFDCDYLAFSGVNNILRLYTQKEKIDKVYDERNI